MRERRVPKGPATPCVAEAFPNFTGSTTPPALAKKIVMQMLALDLFAIANRLVFVFCCYFRCCICQVSTAGMSWSIAVAKT